MCSRERKKSSVSVGCAGGGGGWVSWGAVGNQERIRELAQQSWKTNLCTSVT